MDRQLLPLKLDLSAHRIGRPQQAGLMTVLPLFGPEANGKFTPPLSGIKLAGVRGYGNVELHNPATSGVAILPLHMGYIQDQAQNHALCGSAFLGAGQKRLFADAWSLSRAVYLQGGCVKWPLPIRCDCRSSPTALRHRSACLVLAIPRRQHPLGLSAV